MIDAGLSDLAEGEAPASFLCPIGRELMRDPVMCADGHSYERDEIVRWLRDHHTSPRTGSRLDNTTVTPNHALRNSIEEFMERTFKIQSREAITVGRLIGRGSFKVVHEGRLRGHADPVAVLKLDPSTCITDEVKAFVKLGRHPHLVRFLGVCLAGPEKLVLTELAPLGSLDNFMADRAGLVPVPHKVALAVQICSGMATLSEHGLVHRDLAARNVLVFSYDAPVPPLVKVSDFGLTVDRYGRLYVAVQGEEVPFRWMPPEALRRRAFS